MSVKLKDGERINGILNAENTGMELVSADVERKEKSSILYKNEYGEIDIIIRLLEKIELPLKKKRDREFKRIHKRPFLPTLMRGIRNIFGTVRDSVMEAVNLFMGKAKGKVPGAKFLQGQDKYLDQLKQQTASGIATAYEPILERYIGKKVILLFEGAQGESRFTGILKDYTPQFICMMDVELKYGEDNAGHAADVIVPRDSSVVRYSSR